MQNVFSPMANMYQAQLEASRRFADAIFSGAEQMDRLLIGATHRVFNEQLKLAEAISSVRDPRNIGSALQSGLLSRKPDEAINYQQEFMRICAEVQSDISNSMQEYLDQAGLHAAASPMHVSSAAHRKAADTAFDPVTGMFSVWESAFKEVAALARKNMTTAREAVEEATGKVMESAATYSTVASEAAKNSIILGAETAAEEKKTTSSGKHHK